MNRVDLALAEVGSDSVSWLCASGRDIRRDLRLSAMVAMHRQATAITTRIEGWRRLGEPKGYSFQMWSTMGEDAFRRQCRFGVARGSATAERQLALLLVSDVRAA